MGHNFLVNWLIMVLPSSPMVNVHQYRCFPRDDSYSHRIQTISYAYKNYQLVQDLQRVTSPSNGQRSIYCPHRLKLIVGIGFTWNDTTEQISSTTIALLLNICRRELLSIDVHINRVDRNVSISVSPLQISDFLVLLASTNLDLRLANEYLGMFIDIFNGKFCSSFEDMSITIEEQPR